MGLLRGTLRVLASITLLQFHSCHQLADDPIHRILLLFGLRLCLLLGPHGFGPDLQDDDVFREGEISVNPELYVIWFLVILID